MNLGSIYIELGNVDEALRGYLTKYDCSSGDINPIGSISKVDLKRFLAWAGEAYGYSALLDTLRATPTAELRPIRDGVPLQTDEDEMGMSYEELGVFGRLRKIHRCGPLAMFMRLVAPWQRDRGLSPRQVAEKGKRFFRYYAINRHKLTTLTPSYHAEMYSPDDNRFDLRPFLYPAWERQFNCIDENVKALEEDEEAKE